MKKLLSMLLAAAMLVSASAMAFAEGTSEKGTIVYGSSTEIGGDFGANEVDARLEFDHRQGRVGLLLWGCSLRIGRHGRKAGPGSQAEAKR